MVVIYGGKGAYTQAILEDGDKVLSDRSVLGQVYPVSVYYSGYLIKSFTGGIDETTIEVDGESTKGIAPFEIGNSSDPVRALGKEVRVAKIEIRSGVMYLFITDYVPKDEKKDSAVKELEYFHFGAKDITLTKEKSLHSAAFISAPVAVTGSTASIEVDANTPAGTGLEIYFIIDEKEIPVMPYNWPYVQNEKIFPGFPTRFAVDEEKDIAIYKEGIQIDITMEQAMNDFKNEYAISYYPRDMESAKVIDINSDAKISIKYILRSFADNDKIAYVSGANIITSRTGGY